MYNPFILLVMAPAAIVFVFSLIQLRGDLKREADAKADALEAFYRAWGKRQ